ncbi:MAG: spore coat protein [Oscillospiraceae bacterium]|jgi:spore coat protein CotF|nr:spore coat protein [Oscillospiraceae bacterium]
MQGNNTATQMTDKEYMQDLLLTSKTLTGLYHYATQESCTEPLHSQFKQNLNETLDVQSNIFTTMQQNGWYQTSQAPVQQVSQVKSKFTAS